MLHNSSVSLRQLENVPKEDRLQWFIIAKIIKMGPCLGTAALNAIIFNTKRRQFNATQGKRYFLPQTTYFLSIFLNDSS